MKEQEQPTSTEQKPPAPKNNAFIVRADQPTLKVSLFDRVKAKQKKPKG